jgi:hypothetical protein
MKFNAGFIIGMRNRIFGYIGFIFICEIFENIYCIIGGIEFYVLEEFS